MTEGNPDQIDQALAELPNLERELLGATEDWTRKVVARHYVPDPGGEQDRADELLLFSAHGYDDVGPLGLPNRVVFQKRSATGAGGPATIVRTYRGKQQADAVASFEKDAADLAPDGYLPTSQSWAQGQWGAGAFLVAFLLVFVLVGILVFIYMLLVKPEGTLVVTYTKATAVGGDSALSTASTHRP